MAATFGAHPELIGGPRHSETRLAHVHLRPAPLTADLKGDVAHAPDSSASFCQLQDCGPVCRIGSSERSCCTISGMIPAIVLAAGKSTRMGRAKANLPLGDGDTFLSRIVSTFHTAGVSDVVVVVGHDAASIVEAFPDSGVVARFVENPDYERGQWSSLVKGLNAIDRPGVAAALVTLVDVPLVTPATVRAVVERYRQTRAPVVRPVRGDQHGHPVLIDRSVFDQIRCASPDAGAKPVVRALASVAGDVAVDDRGAFLDIDTMDEYQRVASGVVPEE